MRTIGLWGLALAVIAVAGLALACNGGGEVLRVEPSPQPGDLGSRESPIPFGAQVDAGPLRVKVDKWELVECLDLEGTSPRSSEDCPDEPFSGQMVRFYASVRNESGDQAVNGMIRFFVVSDDAGLANLLPRKEDRFPRDAGLLEPGQTIKGWVYSVRPELPVWKESERVVIQMVMGDTPLTKGGVFWQAPPPPALDEETGSTPETIGILGGVWMTAGGGAVSRGW